MEDCGGDKSRCCLLDQPSQLRLRLPHPMQLDCSSNHLEYLSALHWLGLPDESTTAHLNKSRTKFYQWRVVRGARDARADTHRYCWRRLNQRIFARDSRLRFPAPATLKVWRNFRSLTRNCTNSLHVAVLGANGKVNVWACPRFHQPPFPPRGVQLWNVPRRIQS